MWLTSWMMLDIRKSLLSTKPAFLFRHSPLSPALTTLFLRLVRPTFGRLLLFDYTLRVGYPRPFRGGKARGPFPRPHAFQSWTETRLDSITSIIVIVLQGDCVVADLSPSQSTANSSPQTGDCLGPWTFNASTAGRSARPTAIQRTDKTSRATTPAAWAIHPWTRPSRRLITSNTLQ